ncbi:MAG TPA: sulfatase-like hydrolase/transferase [Tepidisphaeraceae bacterium]|jgi:arylsulfatase A-like enzyme|nr:sulfatase-like hydrolase/transferase [Tepidisphaeraceae bacterium]
MAWGRQPNVLFILTDDQGSVDVNCYGSKDLVTPGMDSIAKRGVRFTQFEAGAPICSPSRASIMTGMVPQKAGLPTMASSQRGGHGMPGDRVTMAEIFKSAGYATGHVGKWHLGYVPEEEPNAQGFDYSFGNMGGCLDNYSHFFYWEGPNQHDLWRNGKEVWYDGQFYGDLMEKECEGFIEKHREEPFFLYWAINEPHYPLQGVGKWRDVYKDLPSPRNMYAALVSTADERIGMVLAKLDELKLREDTIVVFMSDQGHSTEVRTFGGGGNAGPYRGAKFSLFEGGIRVPAMISWVGHLPEGEVRGQLATGCDWLPTLTELAGVKVPDEVAKKLDGKSLMGVIQSAEAKTPHERFYWASGKNQWVVREGDWKMIGNPYDPTNKGPLGKGDAFYLVNLKEDIGEMHNVAAAHPDLVQHFRELHQAWMKEVKGEEHAELDIDP